MYVEGGGERGIAVDPISISSYPPMKAKSGSGGLKEIKSKRSHAEEEASLPPEKNKKPRCPVFLS